MAGFSRSTVYRWERGQTRPRRAALKLLDRMIRESRAAMPQGKAFRFIDLFAGIGGCVEALTNGANASLRASGTSIPRKPTWPTTSASMRSPAT
nr:hypothetical protein [Sphingomonas ginkgonis]